MMAARIKQFQAFMALTQMLVMPLFFLSGARCPLSGLPGWLSVLTRLDPLTYIVGPMRHAVLRHLGIVALMGLGMMSVAIAEFRKTE